MTNAEREMQFRACRQRCVQCADQVEWKNQAFWTSRTKRFVCKWNKGECASQWRIIFNSFLRRGLSSTSSGCGSGGQVWLRRAGRCRCRSHSTCCICLLAKGAVLTHLVATYESRVSRVQLAVNIQLNNIIILLFVFVFNYPLYLESRWLKAYFKNSWNGHLSGSHTHNSLAEEQSWNVEEL